MAVMKIAKHPEDDDMLRRPARPVVKITEKTRQLVRDMIDTMNDAVGVGLAAPQVFVSQRLFVYDTGDGPRALINPEVLESEGEELGTEGCLSIPKLQGDVPRSTRLLVSGLNEHGRRVRLELHDFPARVFQHEIDHLNGVLFTDRAVQDTLHWLTDEEEEERRTGKRRRRAQLAASDDEIAPAE